MSAENQVCTFHHGGTVFECEYSAAALGANPECHAAVAFEAYGTSHFFDYSCKHLYRCTHIVVDLCRQSSASRTATVLSVPPGYLNVTYKHIRTSKLLM
eukprot:9561935-Ditylum_brightwellii.AAC.1